MAAHGKAAETFQEWFWQEDFWLPGNISWTDLTDDKSKFIPSAKDLWLVIPVAIGLFTVRLLWERFLALPLGRYLNIKESPPRPPVSQPVLENSFKTNKLVPSHHVIEELAKKIDWTPRQVERWWRRRRVQNKSSEMHRWTETSWRFTFYFGIFWYGLFVLWDKAWFWDTKECWIDYPKQHVTNDIWAYYMIELGFYFSLLLSLCMDIKRKDFAEQVIHHVCTLTLLTYSYATNFTRAGSVILIVHDTADFWLEGAKLAKYAKFHKLCDILFIVFTAVWFITRICIYPLRILRSTFLEGPSMIPGGRWWTYDFMNGLLCVLQVLHVIWFYMICRMLYSFIAHGKVEKDERSETEPETNSEDEEIIQKPCKDQVNGKVNHMNRNNNINSKQM